jgi:hypothetical protein
MVFPPLSQNKYFQVEMKNWQAYLTFIFDTIPAEFDIIFDTITTYLTKFKALIPLALSHVFDIFLLFLWAKTHFYARVRARSLGLIIVRIQIREVTGVSLFGQTGPFFYLLLLNKNFCMNV